MTEEEAIKYIRTYVYDEISCIQTKNKNECLECKNKCNQVKAIETVLNLIQTKQEEIKKKENIINHSINEIEKIRQYFSEDLQVEFIRILEILKDKKVIEW